MFCKVNFSCVGIISSPEDSLFSYNELIGESWAFFYDPNYIPAFEPTFDDPFLEELAIEICGDSHFCLFDIAATKRPEIGMTTAVDNENYDVVVNMSQPGKFHLICFWCLDGMLYSSCVSAAM